MTRCRVRLQLDGQLLLAEEPSDEQVQLVASRFAVWYSDAHNSRMMGGQLMTAEDTVDCFREAKEAGNRFFFLYFNGELAGDADFRRVKALEAEFAIMVGNRASQGRGLGTAFSRMIHRVGYEYLGLERVYLTVLTHNVAGRRCYEKLGYEVDRSEEALTYVESEDDIPMSLTRERFQRVNAEWLDGMEVITDR